MRVLFAIFVLSIVAILWTAVAVARHIRRNGNQDEHISIKATEPDHEQE
ncbi:hypothetical protein [Pseudacidobacterium ailaaui]|jgi:hypothetical protein|nr:hypothetical protein [Pseudacidobacterium ailaaui]MCL6464620.1 hypothetical protein [Pseudacidobacterium ailaaui]